MRRDAAPLADMANSASRIMGICRGLDLAALSGDETRQAAVLHHIAVIGEAASRISPELRVRHTAIPRADIVSQRNRVVHAYFGLDWSLLWKTISVGVPVLLAQVNAS